MTRARRQPLDKRSELGEFCEYVRQHQQPSREPQRIANVLSKLLSRRGYAQIQVASELAAAWVRVVGSEVAQQSRVGTVKRGVLRIVVQNSALLQELSFRKQEILATLVQIGPSRTILDLQFRVGPTD